MIQLMTGKRGMIGLNLEAELLFVQSEDCRRGWKAGITLNLKEVRN